MIGINTLMANTYNTFVDMADKLKDFNDSMMWLFSCLGLVVGLMMLTIYKSENALKKFSILVVTIIIFNYLYMEAPNILSSLFNGTMELSISVTGVTDVSPQSVFNQGMKLVYSLLALGVKSNSIGSYIFNALIFFSIFISSLMIFLLLSADLFVIYIRFYVLSLLSGTMVAFGVFQPTRIIFWKYVQTIIGLLFYLFIFFAMLVIFIEPAKDWIKTVNNITQDVPVRGVGEWSDISGGGCWGAQVSFMHYVGPPAKYPGKHYIDRCTEFEKASIQAKKGIDNFYTEKGIIMVVTLILAFIVIKTITPWIASMVGIGGYDTKGSGIVGQISNMVSRSMNSKINPANATKSTVNTAKGLYGGGKSALSIGGKALQGLGIIESNKGRGKKALDNTD